MRNLNKKIASILLIFVLVVLPFTVQVNAKPIDVIVAVIDTGADITHPVFANRIVKPQNFTSDSYKTDVADYNGHGTHVAGIIAAESDAKIMPLKVISPKGSTVANLARAIRYAADNGADVINISLVAPKSSVTAALNDAISYAKEKGCVLIAAVGNDGGDISAPACLDGVIAVGAIGCVGNFYYKASFSNFDATNNKEILYAKGERILSAYPRSLTNAFTIGTNGARYAHKSGTSMAAANVSSVACLLKVNGSTSVDDDLLAIAYQTKGMKIIERGRIDAIIQIKASRTADF